MSNMSRMALRKIANASSALGGVKPTSLGPGAQRKTGITDGDQVASEGIGDALKLRRDRLRELGINA